MGNGRSPRSREDFQPGAGYTSRNLWLPTGVEPRCGSANGRLSVLLYALRFSSQSTPSGMFAGAVFDQDLWKPAAAWRRRRADVPGTRYGG